MTEIASNLEVPVKRLLVDLDGTLLANRNLALSFDFFRRAIDELKPHGGIRKALRALFAIQKELGKQSNAATNDVRVVEVFAEKMDWSLEEARQFLREGVGKIFPSLKRHFYPVQGAKDFLEWAKDHYPLILATNPVWPQSVVEMRVRWAGIDPAIFQSLTHVRRMRACKPAAQYYQELLEQEGLRAEECLLIGDNTRMDLPATRVGIRVFIVGRYKKLKRLEFSGAQAPAWRGSYSMLKRLLEESSG